MGAHIFTLKSDLVIVARMHIVSRRSLRAFKLLPLLVTTVLLFAACGSDSDTKGTSGGGSSETKTEQADDGSVAVGDDGLRSIDGRAVKANETELVLRLADGERTFKIKPEDVAGVDPGHFNSHVGIPTLGFRVYFRPEGDTDYAVSAEEIKGSDLGFD